MCAVSGWGRGFVITAGAEAEEDWDEIGGHRILCLALGRRGLREVMVGLVACRIHVGPW